MALRARDEKVQMPVHMLLIYPVAGTDMTTPSYKENANAMPLSKDAMAWFVEKVIADPGDKENPMLDIVGKADLSNLPDATIITAEIDPLMSEGRTLARKLREAGSDVEYQNYEGAAHEFFGMAPVVRDADRAQDFAARELRDAFDSSRAATGAGQGASGKARSSERANEDRKGEDKK